jgi:hypothetical protein
MMALSCVNNGQTMKNKTKLGIVGGESFGFQKNKFLNVISAIRREKK